MIINGYTWCQEVIYALIRSNLKICILYFNLHYHELSCASFVIKNKLYSYCKLSCNCCSQWDIVVPRSDSFLHYFPLSFYLSPNLLEPLFNALTAILSSMVVLHSQNVPSLHFRSHERKLSITSKPRDRRGGMVARMIWPTWRHDLVTWHFQR